jgi:hypothetical protein
MGKGGKAHGSKKQTKTFRSHKKNYNKKSAYKKPNRYMMVKKQIERNKESEDILKRQQLGM